MKADAFVMFSLDQEGKPSGFSMKAISPLTDFSYDFHDLDFHPVTKINHCPTEFEPEANWIFNPESQLLFSQ